MNRILNELFSAYPVLEVCRDDIENAYEQLSATYSAGGKVLLCGNGGSAADCEHITGELMKGFNKKRPLSEDEKEKFLSLPDGELISSRLQGTLRAVSLVSQSALMTAFINDVDSELVFAQQVWGYADKGDTLIALSTSGNSRNVVLAAETAHARGAGVLSITGEGGGRLKMLSDCTVALPAKETYAVQELTLPVYHALCAALEEYYF